MSFMDIPYDYASQSTVSRANVKLNSINILLQTINELPIAASGTDDLDEYNAMVEAQLANSVLEETKRAVLADGWDINTDKGYLFTAELESGYILFNVPSCVIDLSDPTGLIQMRWDETRQKRLLYFKKHRQMAFAEADDSLYKEGDEVEVDIVWDMRFEGLSDPLLYYITVRAARIFQARMVGDKSIYSFTLQDEEDARLAARRSEERTGGFNILENGRQVSKAAVDATVQANWCVTT